MNSNRSRAVAALFALLVITLPLHAGKRRAVKHAPPDNQIFATVTGTVLDDTTGQPVRSVKVIIGTKSDFTDSQGKYRIRNASAVGTSMSVLAERSGYESKTATLTTGGNQVVDFRLVPRPTVSVRTTDGVTRQIDFESIRFGYTLPFAGYVDDEAEDFCKPDGTAINVDRSAMKKITGPATEVQVASCCTESDVLRVKVELRTGETTDVAFVDSCDGYVVDLIGRNHVTGEFEYLHFTEIAEVVFP